MILPVAAALVLLILLLEPAVGFAPYPSAVASSLVKQREWSQPVQPLGVYTEREADLLEQMVGGERFEMSALPDSMMDTTLFVGNLCEFVNDDDLSDLFRSVSSLRYLPACVVRKPDMTSLQYGFVSFPSVQEKEAALLRFHNVEFRGRMLKVEPIKDHPRRGRVRLPERMISYVSGSVKTPPARRTNNKSKHAKKSSNNKPAMNSLRRISRDDVERLSRGQPAKKKGYGSRSVPHRLNDEERAEMQRAQRKGFVSLRGANGSHRRSRKGSPLANIFRQWCDARGKPNILLYKATSREGRQPLDKIVVDLSPLRLYGYGCVSSPFTAVAATRASAQSMEAAMIRYMDQIETAAANAGMNTCAANGVHDDDDEYDDDDDDDDDDVDFADESNEEIIYSIDSASQQEWATKPIWQLPFLSAGEYWGQRSQAKAMAKELALLWDIPELDKKIVDDDDHDDCGGAVSAGRGPKNRRSAGAHKGGRTKMKGLSQYRKRGGGHRQSWY